LLHASLVFSFSQNPDQLSQWRGYCPTANGYALGFYSKVLEQSHQNEGLSFLAPCIYDETKQAELIDGIIF